MNIERRCDGYHCHQLFHLSTVQKKVLGYRFRVHSITEGIGNGKEKEKGPRFFKVKSSLSVLIDPVVI